MDWETVIGLNLLIIVHISSTSLQSSISTNNTHTTLPPEKHSWWKPVYYVIIGCGSAFLVLIVIIICLCCRRRAQSNKTQTLPENTISVNNNTTKKRRSIHDLITSSSHSETKPPVSVQFSDIGHAAEIDYEQLVKNDLKYRSNLDLGGVYEVPDYLGESSPRDDPLYNAMESTDFTSRFGMTSAENYAVFSTPCSSLEGDSGYL